jgi:transcription initiation factor TFIIH subunit 4
MALLYRPEPMPIEEIDAWVKPEYKREKDQALSVLRSLHVVNISVPSKEKKQVVYLTANFRRSYRQFLEGGGPSWLGIPSSLPAAPEVNRAFLDRYSRKKWDEILHYVVSKGLAQSRDGGQGGPRQTVRDILLAGKLVEPPRSTSSTSTSSGITKQGFTFLLQEANAQVWTLLLLWMSLASHDKSIPPDVPVDMLAFLFFLASMELGRAYDTKALPDQRKNMLPFLDDIGVVYVPPQRPQQYFLTKLATSLINVTTSTRTIAEGFAAATTANAGATLPSSGPASSQSGSIIVETNFRLYAYTSNPLQIAIIGLFAKLRTRYSDMVTAIIRRKTIQQAVRQGITADQIINYLTTHAHEQMTRRAATENRPVLPPTVADQIRLWQLETERMATTPGYLFKNFDDFKEYSAIAAYAEEIGVLQWRDDKTGRFFATKHEQISSFMKLRKKMT